MLSQLGEVESAKYQIFLHGKRRVENTGEFAGDAAGTKWSEALVYDFGRQQMVDEAMFSPQPPKAGDYSSPAPSAGSSAASTLESRFMLMAWISAIRCLNAVPSISSSTSRHH